MRADIPGLARSDSHERQRHGALRGAITGGVLAAIVAIAVGALILSNTYTARVVADDAVRLEAAEATLGANGLALKALTQAVLLKEDELLGVADSATVDLAIEEAETTVDDLEAKTTALASLVESSAQVVAPSDGALTTSRGVISALRANQVEAAGSLLVQEAKPAHEALRDVANEIRSAARSAIDASQRQVDQLAAIVAFAIAFFIPAAAVIGYRQLAQRQLRIAEAEVEVRLEAEQKIVKAKDEFIASISHELRTPLTSIYGFSELLLEQGFIDPQTTGDLVGLINREAGELGRMVEDLLTMARQEAGSLALHCSHVDVATEVSAVVAPLTRLGVAVELDVPTVDVWADGMRLRQIVRNLLSNAQRHGGPDIRISGSVSGDTAVLTVADNGPGVPPEQRSRLFARFVHDGAAPLLEGSVGLGLAVARSLLDDMGGTIEYRRTDEWTRFIVSLPCSAPVVAIGPADTTELPRATGTG